MVWEFLGGHLCDFVMLSVVLVMFVDFSCFLIELSLVDVTLAKPSYLGSLPKIGLE